MSEAKQLKHLEMIQGVITRMAGNLFYLRGWSITLAAGLLALLSQKDKPKLFPLVILAAVAVIFWIYDGYFLAQERRYRDLYNEVRKMENKEIDFSMDASKFAEYKKNTIIYCMCSKTLAPFYILILIATVYLILSTR